jgi:diacylglycerol kinase
MKISLPGVLAAIVVVLGLSVAMIPKYIFPICESGNLAFFSSFQPVMRCFWFGRMELFLGGLVVLCGLIFFFRTTPESRFAIGALLIGLGLVIILVSVNTVIGSTCGHMHSICQIGTKPAERIAGAVVIIFGLIMVVFPGKRQEQK